MPRLYVAGSSWIRVLTLLRDGSVTLFWTCEMQRCRLRQGYHFAFLALHGTSIIGHLHINWGEASMSHRTANSTSKGKSRVQIDTRQLLRLGASPRGLLKCGTHLVVISLLLLSRVENQHWGAGGCFEVLLIVFLEFSPEVLGCRSWIPRIYPSAILLVS